MRVARSEPFAAERRVLEGLVADARAARGELVEVSEPDLPDLGDLREVAAHLVEAGEVIGGLDDDRGGARVGQVEVELRGRGGLVDRNEHGTGEPGREVDESPLVAGLAHEADLLAGLDAGRDEALGERDHLAVELGDAQVFPAAIGGGEREERRVRGGGKSIEQQIRHVGFGIRLDNSRQDELVHGSSFDTDDGQGASTVTAVGPC